MVTTETDDRILKEGGDCGCTPQKNVPLLKPQSCIRCRYPSYSPTGTVQLQQDDGQQVSSSKSAIYKFPPADSLDLPPNEPNNDKNIHTRTKPPDPKPKYPSPIAQHLIGDGITSPPSYELQPKIIGSKEAPPRGDNKSSRCLNKLTTSTKFGISTSCWVIPKNFSQMRRRITAAAAATVDPNPVSASSGEQQDEGRKQKPPNSNELIVNVPILKGGTGADHQKNYKSDKRPKQHANSSCKNCYQQYSTYPIRIAMPDGEELCYYKNNNKDNPPTNPRANNNNSTKDAANSSNHQMLFNQGDEDGRVNAKERFHNYYPPTTSKSYKNSYSSHSFPDKTIISAAAYEEESMRCYIQAPPNRSIHNIKTKVKEDSLYYPASPKIIPAVPPKLEPEDDLNSNSSSSTTSNNSSVRSCGSGPSNKEKIFPHNAPQTARNRGGKGGGFSFFAPFNSITGGGGNKNSSSRRYVQENVNASNNNNKWTGQDHLHGCNIKIIPCGINN